jgi:hypothetical protein
MHSHAPELKRCGHCGLDVPLPSARFVMAYGWACQACVLVITASSA